MSRDIHSSFGMLYREKARNYRRSKAHRISITGLSFVLAKELDI